ncbi:MAG: alpha/beta fold hydrolase [Kiritimatiellae bacterium]|nr:alpha/beta fold hydrolase [Kiritimatiellia bacterium]
MAVLAAALALAAPADECASGSGIGELEGARRDVWYGYRRTKFDFEGHTAWVVEPKCAPAEGRPWTWTMQWAEAYVDRTGVLDLLAKGWHHVTIETFSHRMDAEGLRVSRAFQKFLVEKLRFAPKANLVGMSWGGFFSTRYAATYPDCVAKIYLDAPLLTLTGFLSETATPGEAEAKVGPWAAVRPADGDWSADARMPVNMAEPIAKAGIPVLLLYGGQDATVPPKGNCETFAGRFKAAGGDIKVKARPLYGHHPHGEDPDKTRTITDFFESGR